MKMGITGIKRIVAWTAFSVMCAGVSAVHGAGWSEHGVYFATHFGNWYDRATDEEVVRYVEELAEWGCADVSAWFDMHDYRSIDDPRAQQRLKRIKTIFGAARRAGMGCDLLFLANESFADSPKELRADWKGGANGYSADLCGHYCVELCPSKPGAVEQLLAWRREVFAAFADTPLTRVTIWPYDQGGCTCAACAPWGAKAYPDLAKRMAELARATFPKVSVNLSTWYFGNFRTDKDDEWKGLRARADEIRPWADRLYVTTYDLDRLARDPFMPHFAMNEISMRGMEPWGFFGANPMPTALEKEVLGHPSSLGFRPYSEGIYEDLNKVIVLALLTGRAKTAAEAVEAYATRYFGAATREEVREAAFILERNLGHKAELWQGGRCLGAVEKRPALDPDRPAEVRAACSRLDRASALRADALLKAAEAKMSAEARRSWRWRLLRIRAGFDAAAARGEPLDDAGLEELAVIYHAAGSGTSLGLKPISARQLVEAARARRESDCSGNAFAADAKTCDLVVYGSSPAAISAAVQAKRMGRSCVIVSPETRIGGLTTGGLGQTDIGNKSAFGGIALEFYRAVAAHYRRPESWKWQKRSDYLPDGQCAGTKGEDSMWTFEPSAALAVLEGWERRDGLEIVRAERLDRSPGGVTKKDGHIVSFRTLSGKVFAGRMFVDATYEGDLMAAAGVAYTVGREPNAQYGETINGFAPAADGAWNHNLNDGVSAYVTPGDRASGLLPGVEPYNPNEKPGDGDRRVQAYCFRMCLTDVRENRIPFARPANYDEKDYELLFRDYEAAWAHPTNRPVGARVWPKSAIPSIMSRMPNGKTDSNNRCGFSTDFIGRNWAWPEASYAERERILTAHLDYQRGLMWTLANHPRIPEKVRACFSKFGTCRDEFADGLGDGWQRQLYVREARRMVGDYVMTERNCRGETKAPRPVAMGAYTMDSHHVRRMETKDGFVRNEGNVEDGRFGGPYGIDYGAIVPKRGDCANLLVPVCLSASHIAFGSIRMEPVFFALGQAAGTAAAQAIEAECAVQDVPYGSLVARLRADGQVVGTP